MMANAGSRPIHGTPGSTRRRFHRELTCQASSDCACVRNDRAGLEESTLERMGIVDRDRSLSGGSARDFRVLQPPNRTAWAGLFSAGAAPRAAVREGGVVAVPFDRRSGRSRCATGRRADSLRARLCGGGSVQIDGLLPAKYVVAAVVISVRWTAGDEIVVWRAAKVQCAFTLGRGLWLGCRTSRRSRLRTIMPSNGAPCGEYRGHRRRLRVHDGLREADTVNFGSERLATAPELLAFRRWTRDALEQFSQRRRPRRGRHRPAAWAEAATRFGGPSAVSRLNREDIGIREE
jgi:hypothetical protein